MATKFSNQQADYFTKLYENRSKNKEEVLNIIKEELKKSLRYCGSPASDYNLLLPDVIEEFNEVYSFFSEMKFLVEPETYAIDPWGFDQTNLRNFTVVGQVKAAMVCIGSHNIWTISKAKYNKKELYTALDSDRGRTTSWEAETPLDVISENIASNAYHGH